MWWNFAAIIEGVYNSKIARERNVHILYSVYIYIYMYVYYIYTYAVHAY